MSQLSKIGFVTVAGGEQIVTVSSFSIETELLFFNKPFDEAMPLL